LFNKEQSYYLAFEHGPTLDLTTERSITCEAITRNHPPSQPPPPSSPPHPPAPPSPSPPILPKASAPPPPLQGLTKLNVNRVIQKSYINEGTSSHYAIDGNINTWIHSQSAELNDQWVSVEVKNGKRIGYVAVWNRNDNTVYQDWLYPFEVWLGTSYGSYTQHRCGVVTTAQPNPVLVECGDVPDGMSYATLVLRSGTERFLSIAELEVFESTTPPSPRPSPPPPPQPPYGGCICNCEDPPNICEELDCLRICPHPSPPTPSPPFHFGEEHPGT
jgi:hypothetical protein